MRKTLKKEIKIMNEQFENVTMLEEVTEEVNAEVIYLKSKMVMELFNGKHVD